MRISMELRQLKYFARVAETLNFSEAARELCVTQSTLSQQIKQLEGELETPLLLRNSRKVALTEAGKLILPHVRHAIHEAELCTEKINDLNHLSAGTLSIGVTYSFSPVLTETLLTFMKRYPQIKLNICYKPMSELMELLMERKIDFVLAFRPTRPIEGVESHILFQNYLAAIVSEHHPLASKSKVSIADLEHYDIALPAKGLQARNFFEDLISPHNHFRVRITLNEVNILLDLIRQSMYVSVLAEATIHNARGVKAIPLDIPQNEMAGCIHTLKDSYRKKSMQEFIRLLGDSLAVKERQNAWI